MVKKDAENGTKALDPQHAEWLVKNRNDNQVMSAKLYRLLKDHPDQLDRFAYEIQHLVGAAFSLWRSAFLSDKTGYRSDTTENAIKFLAEMIQTNAIAFSSERSARNWTFNYYAVNARYRLEALGEYWPDLDLKHILPPKKRRHIPKDRWECLQEVFCAAVNHFEDQLIRSKNKK